MALAMAWQAEAGSSLLETVGRVIGLPTTPEMNGARFCRDTLSQRNQVQHHLPIGGLDGLTVTLEHGQQLGVGEPGQLLPQGFELAGLHGRGHRLLYVSFGRARHRAGQERRPGRQGVGDDLLRVEARKDLIRHGCTDCSRHRRTVRQRPDDRLEPVRIERHLVRPRNDKRDREQQAEDDDQEADDTLSDSAVGATAADLPVKCRSRLVALSFRPRQLGSQGGNNR